MYIYDRFLTGVLDRQSLRSVARAEHLQHVAFLLSSVEHDLTRDDSGLCDFQWVKDNCCRPDQNLIDTYLWRGPQHHITSQHSHYIRLHGLLCGFQSVPAEFVLEGISEKDVHVLRVG